MRTDRITLAVTAAEVAECRGLGLRLAYLAYRLSPSGLLLRSSALGQISGGVMVIMGGAPPFADAAVFADAIAAECAAGHCEGVYLDFDERTPAAQRLIETLAPRLAGRGAVLYTNPALDTGGVTVLSSSEVTGGSFALYVRSLTERFGERTALEIVPLCMDFTLPSAGQGDAITQERLAELLDSGLMSYYSRDLAAKYFTWQSPDGMTHFVLYDDAYTIREKLETAEREGAREVFLPYTRLRGELPEILGV